MFVGGVVVVVETGAEAVGIGDGSCSTRAAVTVGDAGSSAFLTRKAPPRTSTPRAPATTYLSAEPPRAGASCGAAATLGSATGADTGAGRGTGGGRETIIVSSEATAGLAAPLRCGSALVPLLRQPLPRRREESDRLRVVGGEGEDSPHLLLASGVAPALEGRAPALQVLLDLADALAGLLLHPGRLLVALQGRANSGDALVRSTKDGGGGGVVSGHRQLLRFGQEARSPPLPVFALLLGAQPAFGPIEDLPSLGVLGPLRERFARGFGRLLEVAGGLGPLREGQGLLGLPALLARRLLRALLLFEDRADLLVQGESGRVLGGEGDHAIEADQALGQRPTPLEILRLLEQARGLAPDLLLPRATGDHLVQAAGHGVRFRVVGQLDQDPRRRRHSTFEIAALLEAGRLREREPPPPRASGPRSAARRTCAAPGRAPRGCPGSRWERRWARARSRPPCPAAPSAPAGRPDAP